MRWSVCCSPNPSVPSPLGMSGSTRPATSGCSRSLPRLTSGKGVVVVHGLGPATLSKKGQGERAGDKPAAAAITAISALVLLGRRWQPLAVSVAAFAALTVGLAVMPHGTTAQFFGTLATFAIAGAVNANREAIAAWAAGAAMLAYAAWVDPFGNGGGDFLLSL